MISINGKVFSENNVKIVNGRVEKGCITGKKQKFDERKVEEVSNIEKISIYSSIADINIAVTKSSRAEAHFYGQAEIDGDINFEFSVVNGELKIALNSTGDYFNGELKFDIFVPKKKFKEITVKSEVADITLEKGVLTNYLKVKTQTGDLKTNATFTNASISTMSGDVKLCIDAVENISADISTMAGDVSAKFNNISYIDLSAKTMNGDIINHHKKRNGYTAQVSISTMSGDIEVR